jgi:hypothetical protein
MGDVDSLRSPACAPAGREGCAAATCHTSLWDVPVVTEPKSDSVITLYAGAHDRRVAAAVTCVTNPLQL